MKTLFLISISSILLLGCKEIKSFGFISCQKDPIFSVSSKGNAVLAISATRIYVAAGVDKELVNGKFMEIPAGLVVEMFTGKLYRFSIREMILVNRKKWPALASPVVLKAAAAQEKVFEKEKIDWEAYFEQTGLSSSDKE